MLWGGHVAPARRVAVDGREKWGRDQIQRKISIPRIPVTSRNLEIETAEKVENEQAGPVGPALLAYEKLAEPRGIEYAPDVTP